MSAFFSNSSFLPHGLKRAPRSRSRPLPSHIHTPHSTKKPHLHHRPSIRAKPLHILPQVCEEGTGEDDNADSSSASASPITPDSATLYPTPSVKRNRRSARVTLDDAQILLADLSEVGEKRASKLRPIGFTGAQDLSALLSPRQARTRSCSSAAASKPTHTLTLSYNADGDLDQDLDGEEDIASLNVTLASLGLSLDFPRPPSSLSTRTHSRGASLASIPITYTPPSPEDEREESREEREIAYSPTPSMSSSASSATSFALPTTPTTSDDDIPPFPSSPSPASRNDTKPLAVSKRPPALTLTLAKLTGSPPSSADDWTDLDSSEDEDEAGAWYRNEFAQVLTLLSPTLFPMPSSPAASTSTAASRSSGANALPPARPDSLPPPPRRRRSSTSLSSKRRSAARGEVPHVQPTSPHPSRQLDPSFPRRRRKLSSAGLVHEFKIPSRMPPPPPRPKGARLYPSPRSSPAPMHRLLSPALSSPRPPPRTPVPDDVDFSLDDLDLDLDLDLEADADLDQEIDLEKEIDAHLDAVGEWAWRTHTDGEMGLEIEVPVSPQSVYSQDTLQAYTPSPTATSSSFDSHSMSHSRSGSEGLLLSCFDPSALNPRSGDQETEKERKLRSRWSTSTLGAPDSPVSLSERVLKFRFAGKKSSSSSSTTSSTSKKEKSKKAKDVVLPPVMEVMEAMRPQIDTSPEADPRVTRRSSRASRRSGSSGSESGDSTASNGLRRKPIPVEIFMR